MEIKLLTINEATEYLKGIGYPIAKSSIYKQTMKGTIPFLRFGGRKIVFRPEQLEKWAEAQLSDPMAKSEEITSTVAEAARKKARRA